MAFVKLRFGDLFSEPADLIVLPCTTGGTVSQFVSDHLHAFDIPKPRLGMQLGEVDIQPFEGAENIAQFVAFAASVEGMMGYSSLDSILDAGIAIGQATETSQTIRKISAPILGAGAGGLKGEDAVLALSKGFKETATEDSVLSIFTLERALFTSLQKIVTSDPPDDQIQTLSDNKVSLKSTEAEETPMRIFISYSGTDSKHKDWVSELATYLRTNGLDARLDKWHLRRGMDLPQWMANELNLADQVIIISDRRYTDRADGRVGGVGWETMLIQGDMITRSINDGRYIVIVKEDTYTDGVPLYLRTKYSLHWDSTKDECDLRVELLKELLDIEKAPPIGEPPVFV